MKWTETFKCINPSYVYKRGILAAGRGDYQEALDYLARLPTNEKSLNFLPFVAAMASIIDLRNSVWWQKNMDNLDPKVVKRVEANISVYSNMTLDKCSKQTLDKYTEQTKEAKDIFPESKMVKYIEGAILALQGRHSEAHETLVWSWHQSEKSIFILPLRGIHLAKCLSGSKIPVEEWINAHSGYLGHMPSLMVAGSHIGDFSHHPPLWSHPDGVLCHSCWGLYDIKGFAESRGCPNCGGKYLTANYDYTHHFPGSFGASDLDFSDSVTIMGLDATKLPPAEQFKREFGLIAGQRGLGCLAAVSHFASFLPANQKPSSMASATPKEPQADGTEKEPSADSEMSYNNAKKGENDMHNIPPINVIPQTVRAIVAFMPDLAAAQKVANNLPDASILGAPLKVTGGATKQGRHMIQIEGDIPKNLAIPLLQKINDLGGDIQVVAG